MKLNTIPKLMWKGIGGSMCPKLREMKMVFIMRLELICDFKFGNL